jgi:arylsulfatase A-like enzyme
LPKPFKGKIEFDVERPGILTEQELRPRRSRTLTPSLSSTTAQVLDAIDQAGIVDDTIVVWTSDNPAGRAISMGRSNGPWRGQFGSGFEGGMRAPPMVRWLGKVKPGAVTDEILASYDWLPTLASLIGESDRVPTDRPIDGVDASSFLLGTSETTGRDHGIYFGSDAQVMSVKWKTMKVVFHTARARAVRSSSRSGHISST